MQSRAATMRTSDAERQRAADFLRDACAEGRLSPAELEERLDLLFAGSTVEDIAVLVRDLPGGSRVVPRLNRGAAPRGVAPSVPVRRRRAVSPAVPLGGTLVVVGVVWLALAALPPLLAIFVGALVLAMLIPVVLFAAAMAPVGMAVFALAWLANRLLRGAGHAGFPPPGPWGRQGPRRRRDPFV
jgi:Domain of unknown function (DUF1707)